MNCPERIVALHGVPRSGTSWLGQIFRSSPDVAFRFQPLFSYAFKDRLGPDSSRQDIETFFEDIYASDDDFLHQREQIERGAYPDFESSADPTHLVMKNVRYHHVLENLIRKYPEKVLVVGLMRHPCAVMNSWLKAPREFKPEWDILSEWREAPSKNLGRPEEFYGFEKWKQVAQMFLRFEKEYQDNFHLVRYSDLNRATEETVRGIFEFCRLPMSTRTLSFLQESRQRSHPHVNAVYRKMNDNRKWEQELPPLIASEILSELENTGLNAFLEG